MAVLPIELRQVAKCFGVVRALAGVDLHVNPGEVFGLIGPNGSGKTTTVRVLLGLYKPDEGSASVLGADPWSEFARVGPHLGVMLDNPGLHWTLTAIEHLEFFGGLLGHARREVRQRATELLEVVGLAGRACSRLKTYSKGMQQRVALARCLLGDPQLLVLDEPFDGVDAETRRDIQRLLPRLAAEKGVASFVTSHNHHEIERICNRIAIIHQGRIVACDETEALLRSNSRRDVLVIELSERVLAAEAAELFPGCVYDEGSGILRIDLGAVGTTREQALARIVDRRIAFRRIEQERQSLEDVYFSFTERSGTSC